MDRSEQLKSLMKNGETKEALELVGSPNNYHEGEKFVSAILNDGVSSDLLETALRGFLDARVNHSPEHGGWVHSLSHFTGKLWERGMKEWIRRFNKVAFEGACELGDTNCSSRLVDDFETHAGWDDNPADFHLTLENLEWMEWKYFGLAKAIIEAGPFNSEADFIRFKLNRPESQLDHNGNIRFEKLMKLLSRLEAIGEDVYEPKATVRSLVEEEIRGIKAKLTQEDLSDWKRKRFTEELKDARANLAMLS